MSEDIFAEVSGISELIDAVKFCQKEFGKNNLWFRGHSNKDWSLIPSVYRYDNKEIFDKFEKENDICQHFRLFAPSRYNRCPARDDYPAWLFLMQHYGCPTRLLDWSAAPLVATYFACFNDKYDDYDADLWILHPTRLNNRSIDDAAFVPIGTMPLWNLFEDAFKNQKDSDIVKPFATLSEQIDLRMLVQEGAFTVHPDSNPLENLEDRAKVVKSLRIKSCHKKNVREELNLLSIKESVLFPDLSTLARKMS